MILFLSSSVGVSSCVVNVYVLNISRRAVSTYDTVYVCFWQSLPMTVLLYLYLHAYISSIDSTVTTLLEVSFFSANQLIGVCLDNCIDWLY